MKDFVCPACQSAFQVPSAKIPPAGARGRCKACGAALTSFPDGRVASGDTPPPAPPPPDEPIWSLRLQNPNALIGSGPFRLAELREMILRDEVTEDDQVRIPGGTWLPLRAYPAMNPIWAERVQLMKELHGDEDHCAKHRDRTAPWRCPKCKNYLCEECVVNKPYIEGGAPRWMCAACDFDASATGASRPGTIKRIITTIPGSPKKP